MELQQSQPQGMSLALKHTGIFTQMLCFLFSSKGFAPCAPVVVLWGEPRPALGAARHPSEVASHQVPSPSSLP